MKINIKKRNTNIYEQTNNHISGYWKQTNELT